MTGWGTALAVLFAFCSSAGAQDSAELKARAEREIRQTGQIKSHSTDAHVSGSMLSLKDPMPEVMARSWNYFLRLAVQNFTPQGTGGNYLTPTRFEMKNAGATLMPSWAFGFRASLMTGSSFALKWGLGGRIAYTSAKSSARFATGYTISDARLNSTLFSGTPFVSVIVARLPQLALSLGGEAGSVNYTQSSGNKLAAFSERADYLGWSVGAEYMFGDNWSLLADYVQRNLTTASAVGLQKDNYEVGTRLTW